MRALSLTDVGQAVITDIPEPALAAGDVLVRVEMVGLCGTDLNSFRGRNPLVTYPRILGHEIAATVVQGNATLPSGTHVVVSPYTRCEACPACRRGRGNACRANQTMGVQRDGGMTELLAVPADKLYPSSLPIKHLCLVEPLTVGFHAAARGAITSSDIVAVIGCGGVGLGAVAGSAFRGARTIAIDIDDARLSVARLAGATDTIHSGAGDLREQLQNLTNGDGPDVIIEAVGTPDTFRLAVEEVAFTGRVVYIGYAKEPVAYETRLFVLKELDIRGSRNALPQDFRDVTAMLEAGYFPVEKAVSATVSLTEAPSILSAWSTNPAAFTKIMIAMDR